MYLNPYQKYIAELLSEYGPLPERQLLEMVNWRFGTKLKSISGYIGQMCKFADYETEKTTADILLAPIGQNADFDLIRAFDVMLKFKDSLVCHRKSKEPLKITFTVTSKEHDKEISVISVLQGREREMSRYAEDRFSGAKCELAIFLLETTAQIPKISARISCKIAVYDKNGIVFYTK